MKTRPLLALAALLAVLSCSSSSPSTSSAGSGGARDAGADVGEGGAGGGAVPGCIDDAGAYRSATCQDSLDCGEAHACGHNGGACVDCEDGNPCTDDHCALAGCAHYVWLGKACGKGGQCLDDGGCSAP